MTIYTDASWCHKTKQGGWAYWIKYKDNRVATGGGVFKQGAIENPLIAELQAIANGLHVAAKLRTDEKIFVVVTDCQTAINFIKQAIAGTAKRVAPEVDHILKRIPDSVTLRMNKVRAHTNGRDKRSYVNNLVDQAAKTQMKKARRIYEDRVIHETFKNAPIISNGIEV